MRGLVAQGRVDQRGDGGVGGAHAAGLDDGDPADVGDDERFAVEAGVAAGLGDDRGGVAGRRRLVHQRREAVEGGTAGEDQLLGAVGGGEQQQGHGERGDHEDAEHQQHGLDPGTHAPVPQSPKR
ncbi:hypothetical protein [Streptomyces griseoflavus]|uniref:hypothetical protein n=1 Tax=Streptomyces griseoflavus TaxID=35619 RepID=UPI0001B4CCE4